MTRRNYQMAIMNNSTVEGEKITGFKNVSQTDILLYA